MSYTQKWAPVRESPGYSISNDGQVRGKNGKLLKLHRASNGRLKVNIENTTRMVDKLVEEAFGSSGPRCSKGHYLTGDNVAYWGSNRRCLACERGERPNRELPDRL